jgi:hypothetical protein
MIDDTWKARQSRVFKSERMHAVLDLGIDVPCPACAKRILKAAYEAIEREAELAFAEYEANLKAKPLMPEGYDASPCVGCGDK